MSRSWSLAYSLFVALLLTGPIIIGAIYQWDISPDISSRLTLTIYGVANVLHYTIQLLAATLNRRHMSLASSGPSSTFYSILVVGRQEDPLYFRVCLEKIRAILKADVTCLRFWIIIDGDEEADTYMADMAQEIFGSGDSGPFMHLELIEPISEMTNPNIWPNPVISPARVLCVSQPNRGKRHAMYTALWAETRDKSAASYILCTDSDTWIDPKTPNALKQILDQTPEVAASTGHVQIFNIHNLLSLLIDLKYWFAFNLERAAQSHFGCVSCISGPLGMYRLAALEACLEPWIHQRFLGRPTTFGDDRHMTNLLLSRGHQVKYTHKAVCWTETPSSYGRWFCQQTRWGRSFIREYLLGFRHFWRASWWLSYDLTYLMFYSLFLFAFAILMFLNISISSLIIIVTTSVVVALIRSLFAMIITREARFIFFAFFGIFYFCLLLPLKVWSALTIRVTSWGTSGRRALSFSCLDAWPCVLLWLAFLGTCIVRSGIAAAESPTTFHTLTNWGCLAFLIGLAIVTICIHEMFKQEYYGTQARVQQQPIISE